MVLNANQYNAQTYNWTQDFLISASSDDIIFNGLGLQNQNISVSFKNDDNLPGIEINKFQNPIIDGGGVLKRRYTEKQIKLKGYLKSDDASELNNLIDVFKLKTSVVEGYLDIKVNGYYRRTKATVVSNQILDRKHFNINVVPFEITFSTLEPFFYNTNDVSVGEEGVTGDTAINFTYYGTAPSQPRVYLIFGATTTDTVIFTLNDKQLTVNAMFDGGDVLLYDSLTKSVTINGTEVDYTGTFPQIIYGENNFDFKINGTTTVDITILYATNFL